MLRIYQLAIERFSALQLIALPCRDFALFEV